MRLTEDLEVLKQYIETLGLEQKTSIGQDDLSNLCSALKDADEISLAGYVKNLSSPAELQDLIVNTLYEGEQK